MKHDKDTKEKIWRGYTLEQLSHRRAVNAIKQEMTMEQLAGAYSQLASGNVASGEPAAGNATLADRLSSRLSKVITYATYGAQALKIVRQVKDVINQFRSK